MENFVKKLLDKVIKKATEGGKLDKLLDSLADLLLQYVITLLESEVKSNAPAEPAAKTETPAAPKAPAAPAAPEAPDQKPVG